MDFQRRKYKVIIRNIAKGFMEKVTFDLVTKVHVRVVLGGSAVYTGEPVSAKVWRQGCIRSFPGNRQRVPKLVQQWW